MLTRLYSILDIKAQWFPQIFQARSDVEASRQFDRLAKDPQSSLHAYPDDFQLFFIGEFDDSSGALHQKAVPSLVQRSE